MDTDPCDQSGLEGLRADHPEGTVPVLPAVVRLNGFEHLPSYRVPGLESFAMDGLYLETAKEALCTGVIVTLHRRYRNSAQALS